MNQNDMDWHYWRTGERWSSEYRSERDIRGEIHLPRRIWVSLLIIFIVTIIMLARMNVSKGV
jgi:hypothetical protein